MLKYNYVFFNSSDTVNIDTNKKSYHYTCARDLEKLEGVKLVSFPLDYANTLIRKLYFIHRSKTINRRVNLPFKSFWFPFYFKDDFKNDKPYCFVISDKLFITLPYVKYLKNKYPKSKFVVVHRDLVKYAIAGDNAALYSDSIIDLVMSYDARECKQYGMIQFDEFESKIDIPKDKNYPLSDIYFAGYVKDRLPILMDIYHRLTDAGLKVKYYLTGVPHSERKEYEGITYGEHPITYYEMLYQTVNSRCVLEINQEGASGYTSRFLEAVMYNKKLITNNTDILKSKFYNPKYIHVINQANQIDTDFIRTEETVDFQYDNEFSPTHLIERIDQELRKLDE